MFGRFDNSIPVRGVVGSEGLLRYKFIRETPPSLPKEGIAHPNPLFLIFRTPMADRHSIQLLITIKLHTINTIPNDTGIL
jgi:hypothetical protein